MPGVRAATLPECFWVQPLPGTLSVTTEARHLHTTIHSPQKKQVDTCTSPGGR